MSTNLETMLVVLDANVERMRRELRKAEKRTTKFEKAVGRTVDRIHRKFSKMGKNINKSLVTAFAGLTGAALLKTADSVDILQDRITDATRRTGSFEEVWNSLTAQAIQTGTELEGNIELYQRLSQRVADLGATEADVLKLTDVVTKLGIVGGTTTAQIKNGTLQLAQGLGEGIFRAQEFNSVLENTPAVMDAIATGLGRSVPELRKMVIEGQLLSKDVFNALLSQADDVEKRYTEIPPRLSRAWTGFFTAISSQLDTFNEKLELTESLAQGFEMLGRSITSMDQLSLEGLESEYRAIFDEIIGITEKQKEYQRLLDQPVRPGSEIARSSYKQELEILNREFAAAEKQIKKLSDALDKAREKLKVNGGNALPPITENIDLAEFRVNPKPIQDLEEQLNSYRASINDLEIDVLRSQGNIEEAVRRTADAQIAEWEKVATKTPQFAKQAADAITLINEKAAADIAAIETEAAKSARELANAFAVAFESRGIDALINGDIGGAVKGLAKDIAELILRMAVLRPLTEAIFGGIAGGGSGGLFGGIFGALSGKAGGGMTSMPTVVNEAGVESLSQGSGLFIPNGSATIRTAADTKRANKSSSTINVYQTVNFDTTLQGTVRAMIESALPSVAEAAARGAAVQFGRGT